jgi:hypothetical protein
MITLWRLLAGCVVFDVSKIAWAHAAYLRRSIIDVLLRSAYLIKQIAQNNVRATPGQP